MKDIKNFFLVTGGLGFIGSHIVVKLLQAGFEVVILDNLSNSSINSLPRIKNITKKSPYFVKGDIRNPKTLKTLFDQFKIDAVIHLAGLKSVAHSISFPLDYYENNVCGTLSLLNAMNNASVFKLVFSSSATVYGNSLIMPVVEDMPVQKSSNPYGESKAIAEKMLKDVFEADNRWSIGVLRYFNPVGAHDSGLIGENPIGVPSNLFPFICQVAIGKIQRLDIFGGDYPTPDGTAIRDFIHVVDLAEAHLKAIEFIYNKQGFWIWNIGTGRGYSVIEVVKMFQEVTSIQIPYRIVPRRSGDIASCWSDPSKANYDFSWAAKFSIEKMISDAWNWQMKNPQGYG
jgi:UDP-glucose 4-epimerase